MVNSWTVVLIFIPNLIGSKNSGPFPRNSQKFLCKKTTMEQSQQEIYFEVEIDLNSVKYRENIFYLI